LPLGVTMEYLLTGEGERPKEPVTLDPRYPVALENLNMVFRGGDGDTITAICNNLERFSKLTRLEQEVKAATPNPGQNVGLKKSVAM
jgi:hypothetical protein